MVKDHRKDTRRDHADWTFRGSGSRNGARRKGRIGCGSNEISDIWRMGRCTYDGEEPFANQYSGILGRRRFQCIHSHGGRKSSHRVWVVGTERMMKHYNISLGIGGIPGDTDKRKRGMTHNCTTKPRSGSGRIIPRSGKGRQRVCHRHGLEVRRVSIQIPPGCAVSHDDHDKVV